MKIWDIFKEFWAFTGEVDIKDNENIIKDSNKLSETDRALLLETMKHVQSREKQNETVLNTHYHFNKDLQATSTAKQKQKSQLEVDTLKDIDDEER